MNGKILVVDDDENICNLLEDILTEQDLQVFVAHTTEEGWDQVAKVQPNVIVLDVEVPIKGGLEFCRELKEDKAYQNIPILFLTVRGKDMDKVVAFNLGGDDFMTKPFNQKELVARIQVALRRSSLLQIPTKVTCSNALEIDFDRRVIILDKKEHSLSPKEFNLLRLLYVNRHRVVTDHEIFEQLWGSQSNSLISTVYTHVNRLRKKLGRFSVVVKTISGTGFRFDEPAKQKRSTSK